MTQDDYKAPLKIFLRGEPGVGKSTILSTLLKKLSDKQVVGCVVKEIRHDNKRCGFNLVKIPTQEETLLASSRDVLSDVFVSKYSVNINAIEHDLLPFMQTMAHHPLADLLIFDEIGRMQNTSSHFINALDNLLLTTTPLIATIVHDFEQWAEPYKNRPDIFYITVTPQNRDKIPEIIYDLFCAHIFLEHISKEKIINIIKLFHLFISEERYSEIEKLCNHTIKYSAQNRVNMLSNKGQHATVMGDHNQHSVHKGPFGYQCSCLFYINNLPTRNLCSHIQSVMICEQNEHELTQTLKI